jgi:putative transposase
VFKNLKARGFDPKQLKLVRCSLSYPTNTRRFQSLGHLRRVLLVSRDGGVGIPGTIAAHFPNAQQQRCITHKVRGIERHMNYLELPKLEADQKSLKETEAKKQRRFEITSDAYQIYDAPDLSSAMTLLTLFEQKWSSLEPDGVRTFLKGIELTFTFYEFDPDLHHHIRTTNHLERLFREFRTKSDEIGAFPHETSCLTVFCLVVERDHAKHDRGKPRE